MGKTQAEIELDETMKKLERLIPRETVEQIKSQFPETKPQPIRRPIPNKPERLDEEEPYYPEPRWNPKPLPKGLPDLKFDEPKEKKNPWIVVAVIGIILIAGSIGYFGYNLSKQSPPVTYVGQNCTPAPVSNSCGANSCGTCTCTPVVEGSNITCQPATINIFNNGTEI